MWAGHIVATEMSCLSPEPTSQLLVSTSRQGEQVAAAAYKVQLPYKALSLVQAAKLCSHPSSEVRGGGNKCWQNHAGCNGSVCAHHMSPGGAMEVWHSWALCPFPCLTSVTTVCSHSATSMSRFPFSTLSLLRHVLPVTQQEANLLEAPNFPAVHRDDFSSGRQRFCERSSTWRHSRLSNSGRAEVEQGCTVHLSSQPLIIHPISALFLVQRGGAGKSSTVL